MTFQNPPRSVSKGPISAPPDFMKQWEPSQFVDAQSVWLCVVTVGSDLHFLLPKGDRSTFLI